MSVVIFFMSTASANGCSRLNKQDESCPNCKTAVDQHYFDDQRKASTQLETLPVDKNHTVFGDFSSNKQDDDIQSNSHLILRPFSRQTRKTRKIDVVNRIKTQGLVNRKLLHATYAQHQLGIPSRIFSWQKEDV